MRKGGRRRGGGSLGSWFEGGGGFGFGLHWRRGFIWVGVVLMLFGPFCIFGVYVSFFSSFVLMTTIANNGQCRRKLAFIHMEI